jgi:hypothetical protein
LLVLLSVCVSSEQVSALTTWAIAYEKPHTAFTDEVLLHAYTRDTYTCCFLLLRTLPATSQSQWGGKLHLGRFEARIVLVKVCSVVFVFSLGQDHKLFLWLVFDEACS